MWSRAHLRWMSVISSSWESAAVRLSGWEKRLMSSCFLDRHHSVGVNWASASPLWVVSSVGSSRMILRLTRVTAMVIRVSSISWLILHTHLTSLTSYGLPYHRLSVLLDRILSVLRLIWLLPALELSMTLILLLSVLRTISAISLSILSLCHLSSCWLLMMSLSSCILLTGNLILPSLYPLCQLLK